MPVPATVDRHAVCIYSSMFFLQRTALLHPRPPFCPVLMFWGRDAAFLCLARPGVKGNIGRLLAHNPSGLLRLLPCGCRARAVMPSSSWPQKTQEGLCRLSTYFIPQTCGSTNVSRYCLQAPSRSSAHNDTTCLLHILIRSDGCARRHSFSDKFCTTEDQGPLLGGSTILGISRCLAYQVAPSMKHLLCRHGNCNIQPCCLGSKTLGGPKGLR